ncbi:MAG: acetate--CoA ligase family protein [Deltaproteobacteria bacterium]|nr:acetate--CoA ligase family protein [Deltaproteobacteria bacterium]
MNNLNAIFSPESVAIVGASNTPGKVGHDIFANILSGHYQGTLYPVNPKARSILSVKAYPSISEIPDSVDLAIMILPPMASLAAIEEGIKKGIKGFVIVSAGFREVGGEGLEIEERMVSVCREAGVRLVGPNCLGVINPLPTVSLNASFSARMPSPGNISFISQSGALCTAVLDFAADRDIGFSKFISIGNKADVDELDLLQFFHEDPDTAVIMLYIEELRRGAEFIRTVKEITSGARPTPVLAIKSGRTKAGAMAAASHTGALAGRDAVYDAIFKQAGIIRADSIDELFDYANVFSYKQESKLGKRRRILPRGNRVAIVTNAGGPGILATDMTVSSDLVLAEFQKETIDDLASHLPLTANIHNPVDVIGDASYERYENALKAVIRDDGVDGALVILTPQSMTDALGTAQAIVRVARGAGKPIICCFMGIFDVSAGVKYLQENGYPVYRFPENAAKAFGVIYRYAHWLQREHLPQFTLTHDSVGAANIIAQFLAQGKTHLDGLDSVEILKCYGFNVLPAHLAKSEDEAAEYAEGMTFPVVMKITSEQILHKTDVCGVALGIRSKEEAKAAFREIIENAGKFRPDAEVDGVMVQKMAMQGEEIILGMNRTHFGPLLMFGLGGIFVEVFQDVVFRLAPILRNEAHRMIQEIKGYKLLTGFRGRPKADIEAIEKAVVSLSSLVFNHPEIKEMDINPLIVHGEGQGTTVADCRIILEATGNSIKQ